MRTVGRLRAVDRRVYLETDIEVLPGQEVLRIWRQNAAESWTGTKALEGLCRNGRDEAGSDSRCRQADGDHDDLTATQKIARVKQLDGLDEQHFGGLLELFKAPTWLSCRAARKPSKIHRGGHSERPNVRPLIAPRPRLRNATPSIS